MAPRPTAQLFVLQRLADADSLSVGELATRTFTDQSSVSVVAARLVGRGLVRRRRSSVDGRRRELELTVAGRSLLRRSPPSGRDRLIPALDRLGAGDRRALARTLRRLVNQMGGVEGAAAMFFEDTSARARRRR